MSTEKPTKDFVIRRRTTKTVTVGNISIGGDAPIAVQSMTNTDTRDVGTTVQQIRTLEEAGCELIRVAVPDETAARALREIKREIGIPLVADIHFNYRLALLAIEAGVDKLRINPGNIGPRGRIETITRAAKERGIPIRIGVNSGSLERDLLKKYGWVTPEAMVESALRHVSILEDLNFEDIVVSLKSPDVPLTVKAYQLISEKIDYPLHVGITAAGTVGCGMLKSAVGIGIILSQGIGDTIRVSLTGEPVKEVETGFEILKSLGLREKGPTIISCPTCGRMEIDLIKLTAEVEQRVKHIKRPLKVAVMGCSVNGPGEAREADFGIAGGKGTGLVFSHGRIIRKVMENQLVNALMEEIEREITPE
ncbi:MAG TPA: flavodoxin-dependent (E)-4-hydroxy-3-methylbut-2-enyl-diphosphate synthase [Candidatus Latescibacteria bacterium]|nr:flavodoxin-dependent (E)-4-hydroxy-3-methylbut-2-enyl-diphosphate synthase [Candidatus Latescibacterota bacterium]